MREIILEKGNMYKHDKSCCSAYCPLNICVLIMISLGTVTHSRFRGEKHVESRPKRKRASKNKCLKPDYINVFFKGKCDQECQEAGEAVCGKLVLWDQGAQLSHPGWQNGRVWWYQITYSWTDARIKKHPAFLLKSSWKALREAQGQGSLQCCVLCSDPSVAGAGVLWGSRLSLWFHVCCAMAERILFSTHKRK